MDAFLDQLVEVLSQGGGPLYDSELRNARFSMTRLRPGYVMPEVDTFLGEVADAT